MSKLKTLKDLIMGTGEFGKQVDPFILKQEAIKHVKELRKDNRYNAALAFERFFNLK